MVGDVWHFEDLMSHAAACERHIEFLVHGGIDINVARPTEADIEKVMHKHKPPWASVAAAKRNERLEWIKQSGSKALVKSDAKSVENEKEWKAQLVLAEKAIAWWKKALGIRKRKIDDDSDDDEDGGGPKRQKSAPATRC